MATSSIHINPAAASYELRNGQTQFVRTNTIDAAGLPRSVQIIKSDPKPYIFGVVGKNMEVIVRGGRMTVYGKDIMVNRLKASVTCVGDETHEFKWVPSADGFALKRTVDSQLNEAVAKHTQRTMSSVYFFGGVPQPFFTPGFAPLELSPHISGRHTAYTPSIQSTSDSALATYNKMNGELTLLLQLQLH
ncbi:hypothetical protein B0H16DRAFT_1745070 [Mycena metata]|uniref:Uncharacterized protein n=1 Tax=Mycena metata TaxID=1033252 RepID=A0AAD7MD17_9AGAR|nr:hypothetical protein B0H16DRAFT_1745070 [Mycena metata]